MIVGASVLFAYLMLPIPVYNTIWILLIAYVAMYLPYGMRFISSGLTQIHKELEEVAEVAGARIRQIFWRILLPLLAPVLCAAWIYVFVLGCASRGPRCSWSVPRARHHQPYHGRKAAASAVSALSVIQIIPLIIIVAGLRCSNCACAAE